MIPLLILSPLILLAALGAVWKARPVHAALLLALTLALVAVLYLTIGAEFIGFFTCVLFLAVFALLITRPGDEAAELDRRPRSLGVGLACVLPVLGLLLFAFSKDLPTSSAVEANPALPVQALGRELFENSVPAVLAVGVLLTAVLIGAALFDRETGDKPEPPASR